MPNWTYNTITIKGEKKNLDKFMNDAVKLENGELSLSSWIPTPETFLEYDTTNHPNGKGLKVGEKLYDGIGDQEEVITEELIEEYKQATKEQKEQYGVVGWYDYNVMTFGCKWDSEVVLEKSTDTEIVLSTETPWSAPYNWLRTISKKYPELVFHIHADYEEGFWMDLEFTDGLEAEKGYGEIVFDDEEE